MHTTFMHIYNKDAEIKFGHNSEDVHELTVKDNNGDITVFMTVSQIRELYKKAEKYLEAVDQITEGLEECDA